LEVEQGPIEIAWKEEKTPTRTSTWFEIQYGKPKIAVCGSKGKSSCNRSCIPKFTQLASTSTQVVGMWSLALYSTLWHLSPSNKKQSLFQLIVVKTFYRSWYVHVRAFL
jgi:hypothetical protein